MIANQFPPEVIGEKEVEFLIEENGPERAAYVINGTIGKGSPFEGLWGVYAQAITTDKIKLPKGWRSRLVPYQTDETFGTTAQCLDPHDLVVAALFAKKPEDRRWSKALILTELIDLDLILDRLTEIDLPSIEVANIRDFVSLVTNAIDGIQIPRREP